MNCYTWRIEKFWGQKSFFSATSRTALMHGLIEGKQNKKIYGIFNISTGYLNYRE